VREGRWGSVEGEEGHAYNTSAQCLPSTYQHPLLRASSCPIFNTAILDNGKREREKGEREGEREREE
jgi:hypothetical protein